MARTVGIGIQNFESGLGRYDVMMEPRNQTDCAVVMEFKVRDSQ